jgi:hypothetical protein
MAVRSSAPIVLLPGGTTLPSTMRLATATPTIVWTDDPVTTETPIKAVHVNELRHVIDVERRHHGLPPFAWTDDPVIAQYTVIRAVHFLELRRAIQDRWDVAGLGPIPEWAAGSPPAPQRVISARDVDDLRC